MCEKTLANATSSNLHPLLPKTTLIFELVNTDSVSWQMNELEKKLSAAVLKDILSVSSGSFIFPY